MNNQPSFFDRLNNWARNSVTLKLFTIGVLILFLLIPASMLTSLINEREHIRDTAIQEVSSKWGLNQTISGPVIAVPYESIYQTDDGKAAVKNGFVHFLPDELRIEGTLIPEKRYRGIYVVVLYNAKLSVSGKFGRLEPTTIKVPEADIQWSKALLNIGVSDMKGVQNQLQLTLNGDRVLDFGPGVVASDLFASGANIPLDLSNRDELAEMRFSFDLNLNGSSDLYFVPFAKENNIQLTSNWSNPSFEGDFLPDNREVNEQGFSATWKVLQLNRNYPQQGQDNFIGENNANSNTYYDDRAGYVNYSETAFRSNTGAFGVKLLLPIDEYQKSMRSAKYATFFVIITFLTFFFIEVLNRRRLHPIQYILIGSAIILFYVLLLSISEHLSFDWAYWIACLIIVLLITIYSSFVLKNRRLTFMVSGLLLILYGFFYSILQLQDYALLLGSFGLLLILGTIMYLTRNVDWYHLRQDD
ncbi:MAG TPA: cell envelope integrity protein CreD [Saprospiraceae bacterium]|nr:cell envelope integrity protein CreD [Saprospiraceae bacterium]HMQ81276.1 cell envelope integrity protein CreD [Saprospiraceae bacterium]